MLKSVSSSDANGTLFDNLSLRYPIMTSLGLEFDLSPNFHGVETYAEGKEPKQAFTNIKYVKIIMLIIRIDKPDSWTDEDAKTWDVAIRKRFNEWVFSSAISAAYWISDFKWNLVLSPSSTHYELVLIHYEYLRLRAATTIDSGSRSATDELLRPELFCPSAIISLVTKTSE